jgi:hypothetical protein
VARTEAVCGAASVFTAPVRNGKSRSAHSGPQEHHKLLSENAFYPDTHVDGPGMGHQRPTRVGQSCHTSHVSPAVDLHQHPPPTRDVRAMHPQGRGRGSPPSNHPGGQPGGDLWREVPHRIAGREVNPDLRVLLPRGIRDQNEGISIRHSVHKALPTGENGSVEGGPEAGGRGSGVGHGHWIQQRLQGSGIRSGGTAPPPPPGAALRTALGGKLS